MSLRKGRIKVASRLTQKTTIYLEPKVKKFVQLMALQQSKTIPHLINNHFEYQMRRFESARSPDGKIPPAVAEWKIVKRELNKKS